MKALLMVLKRELTPGKILITVLTSALMALILSLVFLFGYQPTSTPSMAKVIYSGMIVFISVLYTLLLSFQQHNQLLNNPPYRINYLTTGVSLPILYWGQKISTIILAAIALVSITLIFFISTTLTITFISGLYFILFLMISSIMVIALAALIKYFINKFNHIEYNVYFILFILLLCSGFTYKTDFFPKFLYMILHYLPFGIIYSGAQKILLTNNFSLIETSYVSLLTITLVIINYFLYKRELGK